MTYISNIKAGTCTKYGVFKPASAPFECRQDLGYSLCRTIYGAQVRLYHMLDDDTNFNYTKLKYYT